MVLASPIRDVGARPGRLPFGGADQLVTVIVRVKLPGHQQLPVIVHANDAMGFGLGFVQGRQEQRGQNRDDGDNNQKFYESESAAGAPRPVWIVLRPGQKAGAGAPPRPTGSGWLTV